MRQRTSITLIFVLLCAGIAVAQPYVISTAAGGAPPETPVPALDAEFGWIRGITADRSGNVYFSTIRECIFKVDRGGVLTRIAGNGRTGYSGPSGDGGPATTAQLFYPTKLSLGPKGEIFIVEAGRVREVTPEGNIATTYGDACCVAVDHVGNRYYGSLRVNSEVGYIPEVVRVSQEGNVTRVVGGGSNDPGDGGPASEAKLTWMFDLEVDREGNLFILDSGRVRRVSQQGIISTVAGIGTTGYSGDGGVAIEAQIRGNDLAIDDVGNIFISDVGRVRKVNREGVITTVAGTGNEGYSGDGFSATSADITTFGGVGVDSLGNFYIAGYVDGVVRKVNQDGIISTIARHQMSYYSGDGGPATAAQLHGPSGVATDGLGNVFIADTGSHRIRMLIPSGIIVAVAGNGTSGYFGDGAAAIDAHLSSPTGVAVDTSGNLFIADASNYRIRRIDSAGIISTIAGTGTQGYSGDAGPAIGAQISWVRDVAVDSEGNLYLADTDNQRVRKVSIDGRITTVAGNGIAGYSGDGDDATNAQLNGPIGLGVDAEGSLFIAEHGNRRIRKVTRQGKIETVAGGGIETLTNSTSHGVATSTELINPADVAVDVFGNLYICTLDHKVYRVSNEGTITWIAGDTLGGYHGDGGLATEAALNHPSSITVDNSGNLYVADSSNSAVRVLRPIATSLSVVSVSNGASNLPGPVSPGEVVVLYGSGIGPAQLRQFTLTGEGILPTELAGTKVLFDGIRAPMIYTSATQVASIVPYSITGGNVQVEVEYQGQKSDAVTILTTASSPGLFTLDSTGEGQVAALNQDGTLNGASNPARLGEVVVLYATGEGQTSPPGVDGKPATLPLPQPELPVRVEIDGQEAEVEYAGAAPGLVAGVIQVNARIPDTLELSSAVPVRLLVGNTTSQEGVTVAVAPR